MTNVRSFLGAIAIGVLGVVGCADPATNAPTVSDDDLPVPADVVVTIGHGAWIGRGGDVLAPSPELFERTQRALVHQLLDRARTAGVLEIESTRARIIGGSANMFLATADFIDWLLERAPPPEHATIKQVNEAMRFAYNQTLPGALTVARTTINSGTDYINECRAAGVPIPPSMYKTGPGNWTNKGPLTTNFLGGGTAELWEYRDGNGLCLALPRYETPMSGAKPFGVICLGRGPASKACFFDNPRDVSFPRNVQVPLESFVGGYALDANGQGTCTDCHAGENPFIVHPNDPAFAGIVGNDLGAEWYEPIVHPSWPQNPPSSSQLEAFPSSPGCTDCHSRPGGIAGRFPTVSAELPGYCGTVLKQAAFMSPPRTMPPSGDPANYAVQTQALRDWCSLPASDGKIVPSPGQPPNPSFLSPPTLSAVAYDCAEAVEVNNVVLDAQITLAVTSAGITSLYTQIAKTTSHIAFALGAPLRLGDIITATQSIDGLVSGTATLVVSDHRLTYPTLPAPTINPDVFYECADVIAVTHVPGAHLTVFSNGTNPVTTATATGWTTVTPFKQPFAPGDGFSAKISMCPGEESPMSPVVYARAAPTDLGTPRLAPASAYENQRLIGVSGLTNGARTTFDVSSVPVGVLDVPISWWPEFNLSAGLGRALRLGDSVQATQRLCSSTPPGVSWPLQVSKCAQLPAPHIVQAMVGMTSVVVASAQPGARLHVYDASNVEIGNGSGTVIRLSRALTASEVITVVQQLGACRSQNAHRVTVRAPGQ